MPTTRPEPTRALQNLEARAAQRTRDPSRWSLPSQYDFGNVRAICYAIDNGLSIEEIAGFLVRISATRGEIDTVLAVYANYIAVDMTSPRMKAVAKAFELYTKDKKIDAHKEKCFRCKKEIIYWNLVSTRVKSYSKDEILKVGVCGKCSKILDKRMSACQKHNGIRFIDSCVVKCPLYPTKCFIKNFCDLPECLHHHMEQTHKGYAERRWKKSKKFLSKTSGKIITSNLMTGVEFEVIGKNKTSTRADIFKLGKSIGIDNDHSLHDDNRNMYHMATEVVTPPASGIKLEDMVYKTCQALSKSSFMANHKCGLHIHIDLFTKYGHINSNPNFYKSLLAAYVLFEPVFYGLVPKVRYHNINIKPIADRYIGLFREGDWTKRMRFSKIWYRTEDDRSVLEMRSQKRHESKYYWANFHSLLRKEGLEIRLMEGSIDAEDILWWTRLHHEFIEAVSELPDYYTTFETRWNLLKNLTVPHVIEMFMEFIKASPEMKEFIKRRYQMHENSSDRGSDISDDTMERLVEQNIPLAQRRFLNQRMIVSSARPIRTDNIFLP